MYGGNVDDLTSLPLAVSKSIGLTSLHSQLYQEVSFPCQDLILVRSLRFQFVSVGKMTFIYFSYSGFDE